MPDHSRSRSTLLVYTLFLLRSEWRTALFWAIGLSIYAGLIVAIYPSIKGAVTLKAIPENLRLAFNISDYAQLAGFLSSQLFGVILPLVLPFYGMVMLSHVVAGAEERGRLDILVGNPIPRYQLIIGTFTVAAAYLLLIVIILGTVVWGVAGLLDIPLQVRQSFSATFALWPPSLFFGALALALSAGVRQRSVALGIPAATVLLMYLALVIGRLAEPVSFVRYISAYNYYGVAIIEGVWWGGAFLLLSSTVALLIVAVFVFNRRDIYA